MGELLELSFSWVGGTRSGCKTLALAEQPGAAWAGTAGTGCRSAGLSLAVGGVFPEEAGAGRLPARGEGTNPCRGRVSTLG